jgi:hypothetical protein
MKTSFNTQAERIGKTYKFVGPSKLYITVNRDAENVIREIFVNCASSGSTLRSLCESLGKLLSIMFQNNPVMVGRVINSFKNDLSESFWHNKSLSEPAKSIPDAISKVLELEQKKVVA